jgi:chromosome segregation ATPase
MPKKKTKTKVEKSKSPVFVSASSSFRNNKTEAAKLLEEARVQKAQANKNKENVAKILDELRVQKAQANKNKENAAKILQNARVVDRKTPVYVLDNNEPRGWLGAGYNTARWILRFQTKCDKDRRRFERYDKAATGKIAELRQLQARESQRATNFKNTLISIQFLKNERQRLKIALGGLPKDCAFERDQVKNLALQMHRIEKDIETVKKSLETTLQPYNALVKEHKLLLDEVGVLDKKYKYKRFYFF